MAPVHRVYLVPGFFGFTHMGAEGPDRIHYFEHVRRFLQERFDERGLRAQVLPVTCHPTGSLRQRPLDVLEAMRQSASPEDGAHLHLIGHSTGGLDARSIVSARMASQAPELVRRIRTVVSVATPHLGTPLASFFHQDRRGATLLRLLYLFTILSLHRRALPMRTLAVRLLYFLSTTGDALGFKRTLPDVITRMLAGLGPDELASVRTFLEQVGTDSSLIEDLTPPRLEGFNARTPDVPHVRYGSVVTGALPPSPEGWSDAVLDNPRPRPRDFLTPRLLDPDAQLVYAIFTALYLRSTPSPRTLQPPAPRPEHLPLLLEALGERHASLSDGIVPTCSQPWGELLHVARADHLDVLGHFHAPPESVSWLKSGSRFRRPQFHALWSRVFDFLVR